MGVPSSGQVSINNIVSEFGGTEPHQLSEYYRDGGSVPGNNTNVPTSGEIKLSDFYGAVNSVVVTLSAPANDVELSTTFGSDWTSTIPKVLNIDSGVTIGATTLSHALRVTTGMGGSLVINNAGSIQGKGGAPGGYRGEHTSSSGNSTPPAGGPGADGGPAISVVSAGTTINNTGSISGGGGSGGGGGAGQRGQVMSGRRAGGDGGIGGLGQGYNQSNTNGSGGLAGPQGLSRGGAGGPGGTFGVAGSAGAEGGRARFPAPGSVKGDGGPGGAAGSAIKNDGATWTNGTTSGTYHGAY